MRTPLPSASPRSPVGDQSSPPGAADFHHAPLRADPPGRHRCKGWIAPVGSGEVAGGHDGSAGRVRDRLRHRHAGARPCSRPVRAAGVQVDEPLDAGRKPAVRQGGERGPGGRRGDHRLRVDGSNRIARILRRSAVHRHTAVEEHQPEQGEAALRRALVVEWKHDPHPILDAEPLGQVREAGGEHAQGDGIGNDPVRE
jgi:hypothetical protein